jgi:hypothetical protein
MTSGQSAQQRAAVGAVGCLIAVMVGVLSATRYGVLVGSTLFGLAFLGIAVKTYLKDPVLALIWLWLLEVLNAPLSATFGYFSSTGKAIRQGDEVLVLLFVGLTIWRIMRTNAPMPALRFVVPGVAIALFGIVGAIVQGVPLSVGATGALLGLKLWVMVVVALMLPWKRGDVDRVYSVMTKTGLAVAAVGLVDFATHGAVSRALHTSNYNVAGGAGYRAEAVHSIFPSPGEYSLFMSLLFAFAFARFVSSARKADLILALVFAGSVLLSLRLKGVLSLVAVVVVVGVVYGATGGRRAIIGLVIGSLLVAVAFSVEGSVISKQLSTYGSSGTTARARLYSTGWQIADEDFPLGVGFGRFASYPSRTSYSPVYYQYKLSTVYGLSPKYTNFIDDTSWPSVIGETGYGGFVAYVLGLLIIAIAMIRRVRSAAADVTWVPLAALCALTVLVADSLGEASLFSWLATATVAMIFGPMMIATKSTSRDVTRVA